MENAAAFREAKAMQAERRPELRVVDSSSKGDGVDASQIVLVSP